MKAILLLLCVGLSWVGLARAEDPVDVEHPGEAVCFSSGLPGPEIPRDFVRAMRIRRGRASFKVSEGRPSRTQGCYVALIPHGREELENQAARLERAADDIRNELVELGVPLSEDPPSFATLLRPVVFRTMMRLQPILRRQECLARSLERPDARASIRALWEESLRRGTSYRVHTWRDAIDINYSLEADAYLGRIWVHCFGRDLTSALRAGFGEAMRVGSCLPSHDDPWSRP